MIGLMARCAAALGGAALVLLASGCGGGTHRVTRAQALAFGREVNPRQILGMSSEGGHEPDGEVARFELIPSRGCGRAIRGERFDFYSPIFRRSRGRQRVHPSGSHLPLPIEGLHSKVSVMQSAAAQGRDFSARVCDMRSRATKPDAQRLPSPLLGVRVLGLRTWRPSPRYMFGPANVRLYSDGFSFVVGSAEVKLAVTSSPRPPNAGLEHYLLSLLYNRAKYYSPLLAGKKVPPKPRNAIVIR
jgi:hypothetical protein